MATIKPSYGTSTALTITIDSLAANAYRESTAVDNSSTLYSDVHVRVTVGVGTASGERTVVVFAYGSEDGSTYPDPLTGSDAGVSIQVPSLLVAAAVIPTPTNTKNYESDVISIARLFGGVVPRKWGIVVHNDNDTNLAASGGSASYTGVWLTAA